MPISRFAEDMALQKEISMKKSLFVVLAAFCRWPVFPCQTATGETVMLNLPRASQHALVSQRIGITDITINYHRPLANGRQIWGKLAPYGQVCALVRMKYDDHLYGSGNNRRTVAR
jgi:hypothetical protein